MSLCLFLFYAHEPGGIVCIVGRKVVGTGNAFCDLNGFLNSMKSECVAFQWGIIFCGNADKPHIAIHIFGVIVKDGFVNRFRLLVFFADAKNERFFQFGLIRFIFYSMCARSIYGLYRLRYCRGRVRQNVNLVLLKDLHGDFAQYHILILRLIRI